MIIAINVTDGWSQILINEVCSRNLTILNDEDGDAEDWIELYNASDSSISLSGYHITNDSSNMEKWAFPEVNLDPGAFFTLFASKKNRIDVIHHFESLIWADDIWRYLVPVEEPDPGWKDLNFVDSTWLEGQEGFGYGDGDDNTLITDTLYTIYLRKHFSIEDTSKIINALLHVDYDDGFLAFINGVEVVRSYITKNGQIPPFHAPASGYHEAQMYQGGLPEIFTINKAKLKEILRNGDNVLAIQAHSRWIDSDLSIIPWLSLGMNDTSFAYRPLPEWFFSEPLYLHTNFKLSSSGESLMLSDKNNQIIDTFYIPFLKLDLSAGHLPDGADTLLFFSEPSPDSSNNLANSFEGITSEVPVFSFDAGFYTDSIILSLTDTLSNCTIRFTRDGSIPNDTSEIYTTPFVIDTTMVIRASCYKENHLSGPAITNTYFINEGTLLPAISVSTHPDNLWDWDHGIYVKGPNAEPNWPYWGANFWEDWEIPAHFEYFDKEKRERIDLDIGTKIHGGWTRGLPMKSLKILTKGKYAENNLEYKFFEGKDIESFKRLIIRNAGNDYYSTFLRDGTVHKLVQNKTFLDMQEYDPAIVFLNGSYWGIHNIREKIDRYWIESNYGIPADEVTLLSNQAVEIDGDADEFLDLIAFIKENDLADENNFNYVDQQIDLENFCDLMITEIHIVNTDWPHNNVKFWKSEGRKWRYFLLDVDASSSLFTYNGPTENMLEKIFADTINYPSIILNNLLVNNNFREYFINRYADLMNTIFAGEYFAALIDKHKEHIKPDMFRHKERWGGTMSLWENHHIEIKFKGFVEDRCDFARNHIIDEFQLHKSDTLTVRMNPPEAGVLKLNTLIPDSLPWTGIYFDSIPVQLEITPNPGYEVSSWATFDSLLAMGEDHHTFHLYRTDTLIVNLTGTPDTLDIVFSEINYRSHPNHDAGDWVEIYNNESYEVDLGSWVFKDSDDQHIFEFPGQTLLSPGGYLVIAEDTTVFMSQYPYINNVTGPFQFGLSSVGEEIRLFNEYGHLLKNMTYSTQSPWPESSNGTGRTIELTDYQSNLNDGTNWMDGCLGGSPGEAMTICKDSVKIITTEINYRSYNNVDAGDWVEIYNNDTVTVDFHQWYFSDRDSTHHFDLGGMPSLHPGEYIVLVQDSSKFHSIYPEIENYFGAFGFGLGRENDQVKLVDSYDQEIIHIDYLSDISWPSGADGSGRTMELIDYNGDLNNGANWKNGCLEGSPGGPFDNCHDTSRIILTEINYYPSDTLDAGEWIEVYNLDSIPVSFKEWVFTDGIDDHIFSFPDDFVLNPGEYVVITRSPNKFHSIYPEVLNTLGSYDFNLSNENDRIIFYDRFGQEIIYIAYDHLYPWPEEVAGTGRTLELKDYFSDLNDGLNWKYGCIGGSPGESFSTCDTTSINDHNHSDEFSFHPNPVKDQLILNFDLPVQKNVHVYIVDLFGRKIEDILLRKLPKGVHSMDIHLENRIPGMYFLIYSSGQKVYTYKLIYNNQN